MAEKTKELPDPREWIKNLEIETTEDIDPDTGEETPCDEDGNAL